MKRILTVDDDAANRFLMVQILSRGGFEVKALGSGLQVMDTVIRTRPALILLDIMMPDRDGLSVLRELKGNTDTAGIPVIMVTAMGESETLSAALEAGATDYVRKPVDSVELLARINAALKLTMYMEEHRKLDQLRVVQEMVGTVSHNINQPLTALRTHVVLLEQKMSGNDMCSTIQPYLNGIRSSLEELIEMVEKLKHVSRYEPVKYIDGMNIVNINQQNPEVDTPNDDSEEE
ncbi:MAG: response regulator [Acidobacteria bacterium]|nr:response regulator [Acidobacteriota bacterium]